MQGFPCWNKSHHCHRDLPLLIVIVADCSKGAVWDVGLRPLACWDCRFEYRRGHGFLSLVSVVCWQVEVSASGWLLIQRSPTERGVSECDNESLIMRRLWPTRAAAPWYKKIVTVVLVVWRLGLEITILTRSFGSPYKMPAEIDNHANEKKLSNSFSFLF
jgi:hypothetical protein